MNATEIVDEILRQYARKEWRRMEREERELRRLGVTRVPWQAEPVGLGIARCPTDSEG